MEASMCMSVELGSINSTPNGCSFHRAGESSEELKHLLVCASLELESVRAAADAQSHVQETKVRQLEELLKVACRERDEARQECFQLQEALSQTCGVQLNCNSIVPSRLSCVQPQDPIDQSLPLVAEQQDVNQQKLHREQQHMTLLEDQLQLHLKQQQENNQFVLVGESGALQLQIQQQQTECGLMHERTAEFTLDRNLHYQDEKHSKDDALSILSTSIQSNASGMGVEVLQPWQIPCSVTANLANGSRQPSLWVDSGISFGQGSSYFQLPANAAGMVQAYGSSLVQSCYSEASQSDAAVASNYNNAPITEMSVPIAGEPSNLPYSTTGVSSRSDVTSMLNCVESSNRIFPQQQQPLLHLPEPPEANLNVMLNSLPEKGKLLQAVMQAGPLLQTLLLAGPLPQWRHPPPVIDSLEIPKVSMPATPTGIAWKERQISATTLAQLNSTEMHMSTGTISISNQSWGSQISSPLSSIFGNATSDISPNNRMLHMPGLNSQLTEDLIKHGAGHKYAKIH